MEDGVKAYLVEGQRLQAPFERRYCVVEQLRHVEASVHTLQCSAQSF